MRTQFRLLLSALLLPLFAGAPAVADMGDTQTFDDPSIDDGWTCDACLINGWNAGSVGVDEGEDGAGDDALLYDAAGRGFHLFTWQGLNDADYNFLGDYVANNVMEVRFRARHTGVGEDVVLRSYVFNGFDDGIENWGLSLDSASIASTDTTWQEYSISLLLEDLEYGDALGTPHNEADLITVLSDVVQFSLRHDPDGTGPGVPVWVDSQVYFDDIRLILDSDGDGVTEEFDLCPGTMAGAPVDEVGCSVDQVDADGDGVCDVDSPSGGPAMCTGIDDCPGTEIPEAVPTEELGWWRWTLDNADGTFTQRRAYGQQYPLTTEVTRGCSCDQILTEVGYPGRIDRDNRRYGCETWIIRDWVYNP